MQKRILFRVLGAAAPVLVVSLFLGGPAFGQLKWQAQIVNVPATYDAGVDADSDGVNDAPNVSTCTGEQPIFPVCGAGDSVGDVCDPADPGNCAGTGSCGLATTAGDGVTAADTPSSGKEIDPKKSKCQVKGGDADKGKGTTAQAKVTFTTEFDTDQNVDASNQRIGLCQSDPTFSTHSSGKCKKDSECISTGTCSGGTCDNSPPFGNPVSCTTDEDCVFNLGPCLTGDEWWVQVDFITSPPQTCTNDCVAGLEAASLGLTTPTCFLGTCQAGGVDTGYLCDGLGALFTCPTGQTCTANLLTPQPDVTKSISFALSTATVYVNCPLETGLSFPMEVKKGKGKVKADLLASFEATVPDDGKVDVLGCYVHEPAYNPDLAGITGWAPTATTPGAPAVSSTLGLGAFSGPASASCAKRPCPPSSAIIDGPGITAAIATLTGSPPNPPVVVNNPVSPILGVSGGNAGKL